MQLKISFFLAVLPVLTTLSACAFSLLGPYEPWMEKTNGFKQGSVVVPGSLYSPEVSVHPADIGGPMDIGCAYRWNVPLVTYGFDQSFLNYFGTNGVAAVESAIQILNNLPAASQIVFTNYPFASQEINYTAQAQSLFDLKSTTLSLLLEQMGLAQPKRYTFALKQWTPEFLSGDEENEIYWSTWAIPDYIVPRNFDPLTLNFSTYVNQILYGGWVVTGPPDIGNYMEIYSIDPNITPNTAVADESWIPGAFYTGLTYDDVGGLCYLLSTNNVNFETLLPGVFGVSTNANSFVNGAWRPGVDRITFVPQPVDSLTGAFLLMTNQFTDAYITNGVLMQQQLARVISQPDFLFTAKDLHEQLSSPDVCQTGTTNWINNASLNGNPHGAGPGIIQPAITITYNIAGQTFWHENSMPDESADDYTFLWGTFDGSSNTPVVYPALSTGANQMTFRMSLEIGAYYWWLASPQDFDWPLDSSAGSLYNFQTSTNLSNWVTLFVVTNSGAICDFFNWNPSSTQRFYQLVPQ